VGSVFNTDSRGGQIANDRAMILDFDAVAGQEIASHIAEDDHFGGANGAVDVSVLSDGEPVVAQ